MHPDEAELNAAMDRYSTGEDSAFATLYRLLHPRFHSYFARMRAGIGGAEDMVQDTFLRLHRSRALFGRGASALPWVYAIARSVLLDHARSAKRRDARLVPDDGSRDRADDRVDVESAVAASEIARTIDRALSRLPESQREAFVLLRYEGLSVKDAAGALGTTPTAVKLRAFRAYEAIRAELASPRLPDGPRKPTHVAKPPAGNTVVRTDEGPVGARKP